MTLSELRFVVSVAQEKNFRRAAAKSFVSQPALSLAIKKIENELGVLIFERNRMGISLTTVGEKIVNQAQIVLEEADKVKAISGLFKGDEGTVTQLIPARERVKVLFEILGRPSEVEIDEGLLDFPSAHPLSSGLT